MSSVETSERRQEKIWGWGDEVFKSIIESALSTRPGYITDISSPPGTRKTLNVITYVLENRIDTIMSFPNHQNQQTALQYILRILERMKIMKLRQFVIDYAGIENYCIFYKPERLMKLLDYFKNSPDDSYVDAVQNMLANDTIFKILLSKDVVDVDEIWMKIGEALDKYKKTGDKREYLSVIKQIVEKKGQYEVCTSICPLGLFAWWWRKELYKFFSEPKIITWRKLKKDVLTTKLPHVSKFIVYANPENFVENIGRLLKGEFKPEWVLCPRYLLMTKISMSPKASRPTFLSTRKSIILTPHAGLDFILHTVRRQTEITGVKRKHILFLDEYDTLLKPQVWRVVSIEVAKTVVGIAEKIAEADIGDVVYGVEVDEYLRRYAEYVRDVLSRVIELFERATQTGEYHPIVNIFVEGAFSAYKETTLKTKKEIIYRPLGARIVHIKHFLAEDKGRLLQLILNPRLYFYDFAEKDKEWAVKYREAVVKFRGILRGVRTPVRVPIIVKQGKGSLRSRLLYLSVREGEFKGLDILNILREYLRPLLIAPRYAVFYVGEKGRSYYKIKLASVDVKIYKLLTWATSSILVSATPVEWRAYTAGSNPEALVESEYERVTKDVFHSLVFFEPPVGLHYEDRYERRYTAHIMTYVKDFSDKLKKSLKTGEPIEYGPGATTRVQLMIKQLSPKISRVTQYTSLLRVHFLPSLQPIQKALSMVSKQYSSYNARTLAIKDYLAVIGRLYATRRGHILILAQNKDITMILKDVLRAIPCHGETCGKDIDPERVSHYIAKKRLVLTYFRSRATRGIDLPEDYRIEAVLVIGSPYPRPTVITHYRSDSGLSPLSTKFFIPISGIGFNTGLFDVYKTHVARDFMAGISELVQAVGRATRSAMKYDSRVIVILPQYLQQRIMAFAPYWFSRAVQGVAP